MVEEVPEDLERAFTEVDADEEIDQDDLAEEMKWYAICKTSRCSRIPPSNELAIQVCICICRVSQQVWNKQGRTIKDYRRLSKTIKDYQRLSKTIKDYQSLKDHLRLLKIIPNLLGHPVNRKL